MRLTTDIFMGFTLLLLAAIVFPGLKYDNDKNSFMSIEDSGFLRAFWCIIVILVHVPNLYQNKIQDLLGSFAYIGVTFFFMTSAYGLKYSLVHKKRYINNFWRRRLPPILIPALIASSIAAIVQGIAVSWENITFFSFMNISGWVKVLLLLYLVFWIIYGFLPKYFERRQHAK